MGVLDHALVRAHEDVEDALAQVNRHLDDGAEPLRRGHADVP